MHVVDIVVVVFVAYSRVWEMALCVEKRLSMPTLRLKRHMSITSIMESIWLWMKKLFDSFVGHILAHKFYQLHNSSNIDFGSKLTIFFRYLCVLFNNDGYDHRSLLLEIIREIHMTTFASRTLINNNNKSSRL